ncbi:hypothetical protein YC2023_042449 [Brassica napus]
MNAAHPYPKVVDRVSVPPVGSDSRVVWVLEVEVIVWRALRYFPDHWSLLGSKVCGITELWSNTSQKTQVTSESLSNPVEPYTDVEYSLFAVVVHACGKWIRKSRPWVKAHKVIALGAL